MQLHTLQPSHRSRAAKRIARGGKRGGYSGRGLKGQKSRAGAKIRPALRDIIKKIPKQRGRSKHQFKSRSLKPVTLNVGDLGRFFPAGAAISPALLVSAGAVRRIHGRIPRVKILGAGAAPARVLLTGCLVSAAARQKIEGAQGSVS
ncbi:uL15 family ribosomal protein [Candidatus Parcubacteria bacterium]|nr:uL15 family ribosomal protein [Candidatus Parcubacteria bacterium]